MSHPLDLDAYWDRIGYRGSRAPTVETLHALSLAHVSSIPFENLDVLLGLGVSLDPATIVRKLVHERRGGYCFEQNGLFLMVLDAMGYRVTPIGARVRWQRPRDFTPPRTHLFARVEIDDAAWLADVGVGGMSLTSAIRLDTEEEQPTAHEPRRIVREHRPHELVHFHQARLGDAWHDVCEFTLVPMPFIDRELGNWFTSAHPQSHFRSRMLVARATPEGRVTLLDRELTVRQKDGATDKRSIADADELLTVLADHFGLHFAPGTRFGPPGSPWPS